MSGARPAKPPLHRVDLLSEFCAGRTLARVRSLNAYFLQAGEQYRCRWLERFGSSLRPHCLHVAALPLRNLPLSVARMTCGTFGFEVASEVIGCPSRSSSRSPLAVSAAGFVAFARRTNHPICGDRLSRSDVF
jgi:hypothetical protein